MNNILDGISNILSYVFLIWIMIMYYLSVKKCFLKTENKKRGLFWRTLFANPATLYIISSLVIAALCRVVLMLLRINGASDIATLMILMICTMGYIVLTFRASSGIGKYLCVYNRPLVSFVTLMYGVIFSLSMRGSLAGSGEESALGTVMKVYKLGEDIVLFVATILFYRLVIKALSELTDKPRKLSPGLFILPPTLFIVFYNVFVVVMWFFYEDNNIVRLLLMVFSDIIMLLFIWAFYIIVKNINATNEAIEAKDMAAELARTEALREADLNIAKNIQSSALPSVFPPFPEHREFELFASMNAAREVGGDFYDFYMIDENTLGILIADVSGKSIPGALFMMTSKTVIKNFAESGMSPAEVFTRANEKLCEGNEAEMFVTAWLGYIDLKTGLVRVANAGHNPPVLIRDGIAEYVILKPGLMLAEMDGLRYREQTMQLEKGDILYLYTDGVTEAMDKDEELYGEDRLQKLLSFDRDYPDPSEKNGIAEPICNAVITDVREFVGEAEQSDDITMLCVRFLGSDRGEVVYEQYFQTKEY